MSSVGFSYAQTYVQKKAVKEKMRRRAEEVEDRLDMATVRPAVEARQGATSSGFSRRVHPTASDPVIGNGGSGSGTAGMSG